MRLISWTLQGGSEHHLFTIKNKNEENKEKQRTNYERNKKHGLS
jgi:hypothetical protein